MANEEYLKILHALKELPFGIGKRNLYDYLNGKTTNKLIQKHRLNRNILFGSCIIDRNGYNLIINNLLINNLIKLVPLYYNQFIKVLEISELGLKELRNPTLLNRKVATSYIRPEIQISDHEKELLDSYDLDKTYNYEQKKAITYDNSHILCIAGAGSGKTEVLTKRIDFLINEWDVEPPSILAITFTRKARNEMLSRINSNYVNVETFNSFCEKRLRKFNDRIYNKQVRVLSYKDKINIIRRGLDTLNITFRQAIETYFTPSQILNSTQNKLSNIFINDIFFLRDYLKFKNKKLYFDSHHVPIQHMASYNMIVGLSNYVEASMKKYGLRNFADQLLDTLTLFSKHPDTIPNFEHVLIDEYQDINSTQIELINVINPDNLFCVGDPRQSIYGWRGSDIKYIFNFKERYPEAKILTLTKNYRSTHWIVKLINNYIRNMGFADLEGMREGQKKIHLKKFKTKEDEFDFVIDTILESDLPRNEIFVLVRTNKLVNDVSEAFRENEIDCVIKNDESRKNIEINPDQVVLSTVHSIKGMEAEMVFVVGCSSKYFPCHGSDHPLLDLIKIEEYDKEEEEKRLLYVAMSRAKSTLYITHTKKLSYFIDGETEKIINENPIKAKKKMKKKKVLTVDINSRDFTETLKQWRKELAKELGLPAYYVLTDKSINEIVDSLPTSLDELKDIHGIGPAKCEKYGPEILEMVELISKDRIEETEPIIEPPTNIQEDWVGEQKGKSEQSISDYLKTKIKQWRNKIAKKKGIPLCGIIHDRTIDFIADFKPTTMDELKRINGMDPYRYTQYGKELLEILNEFYDTQVEIIESGEKEVNLDNELIEETTINHSEIEKSNLDDLISQELNLKLKKWRDITAEKEGILRYDILHDYNIRDIANFQPKSMKELEGLLGKESNKSEKYGLNILEILNEFYEIREENIQIKNWDEEYRNKPNSNGKTVGNIERTIKNEVYNRIKKWRLDLSRELEIYPFQILWNSRLDKIVETLPLTREELISIPGIGNFTVNEYGEDILGILKDVYDEYLVD